MARLTFFSELWNQDSNSSGSHLSHLSGKLLRPFLVSNATNPLNHSFCSPWVAMPQKLRSLALRRIAATWISCNPSLHGILQASKSCMKQPVDFHQLAVHMRGIFLPWIAFCRECKHALMVLTKPWSNTELRWKQRSTWKWITWRSQTNQWSVWISRPVQWRCLDGHGWSMISMQLCSLWQRITASCHPDLESENDWRVAPSAFSSQSHGLQVYRSVEKNPSPFAANWSWHRSTIEARAVDSRTEDYLICIWHL